MVLCDQLEARERSGMTTRNRLATASLARLNAPDPDPTTFQNHAAFALENLTPLTARPDQIKALRQTILNLAIRGKLVAQDPNDEVGHRRLKRIALEKARLVKTREIKTEKKHKPTAKDHGTFQTPASWSWLSFGQSEQGRYLSSAPIGDPMVPNGDGMSMKTPVKAKYYSERLVRMGNLSKDHYRLRTTSSASSEGGRTRLEAGDLLIDNFDLGCSAHPGELRGSLYQSAHSDGSSHGRDERPLPAGTIQITVRTGAVQRTATGHKEQLPINGHYAIPGSPPTPRRTTPHRRQGR